MITIDKTIEIITKRPASLVINSRCDIRTIASLALFWRGQNEPAKSVSEIVRVSLETIQEALVLQGKARHVEGVEEALEIIQQMGLTIPERSRSIVAKALANESLILEGFNPAKLVRTNKNKVTPSHPMAERASNLMREASIAKMQAEAHESTGELAENEDDAIARREQDASEQKLKMAKILAELKGESK